MGGVIQRAERILADFSSSLLPYQRLPQGDWLFHLILSSRGSGKSHGGAAFSILSAFLFDCNIFVIAPRWSDVIEKCLFGRGGSSVFEICPPELIKDTHRSIGTKLPSVELINGRHIIGLNTDNPDSYRGLQGGGAWIDELSVCKNTPELWAELGQILRKVADPRVVATCTPSIAAEGHPLVTELWHSSTMSHDQDQLQPGTTTQRHLRSLDEFSDGITFGGGFLMGKTGEVISTRVPAWANTHLPERHRLKQKERYRKALASGDRMVLQEVGAQLFEALPDAWVQQNQIDFVSHPTESAQKRMDFFLGVDPAFANNNSGDEWGIVLCGRYQNNVVVTHDFSGSFTQDEITNHLVKILSEFKPRGIGVEVNQADALICDWLADLCRRSGVSPKVIQRHRSYSSMQVRALSVSSHIVAHRISFSEDLRESGLISQMCLWVPDKNKRSQGFSPDRVDGLLFSLRAAGINVKGVSKQSSSMKGKSILELNGIV